MRLANLTVALSALLSVVSAAVAPAALAADDAAAVWPPLGALLARPADAPTLAGAPAPLSVRIVARWDEIEREPGVYDWTAIGEAIDALDAGGHRIVLCLTGGNPLHLPAGAVPTPTQGDSLRAWLGFVRSAARSFSGRVAVFEIWDSVGADSAWQPRDYAFLLKNSALAVDAENAARTDRALVAQASIEASQLDWQRSLWREDVAAYVDVLPVRLPPRDGDADALEAMIRENLAFPPAATVLAYVDEVPGRPWEAVAGAVVAVNHGVTSALAGVPGDAEAQARAVTWLSNAGALLAQGYAPAPAGQLELSRDGGTTPGLEGGILGRFFSDADFASLVVYRSPGDPQSTERDRLRIDSALVRDARVFDPVAARERRVSVVAPDDGGSGRVARVFRAPWPLVLRFDKPVASPGFELPTEEIQTTGSREPTAEEIIANYQQVQQVQDDRLERWVSRGRTDLHFKLAQSGSSIDLGIDTTYFWERGQPLEWEQTAYYINGNKVRWKKMPELPLIQPEKVITLPLDLTLDKTYVYRKVGRDTVDGHPTWVLEFQPADPDSSLSLYRGRLWIDEQTWVRRKASVIQTNLEPPVIANEEIDRFQPFTGPDGEVYWLLNGVYGQQTWKAGGATFVVQREMRTDEMTVNPPQSEFRERREAAYASTNQMLRDTDEGFRYLERGPEGERTVKTEVDTSQLFAGGGAFSDASRSGVTPLAGVNYFDYDLWHKNIQVNAFFAGALGFFTASDPDLGGSRLDGTVNAFLTVLKSNDKVFVGDQELEAERIRTRDQNVAFQLGLPLGEFVKLNFGARLTARRFFDSEESTKALDAYNAANPGQMLELRLPADHQEYQGSFELQFNRRGYTVIGSATSAKRSTWERWGLFDMTAGEYVDYDPVSGLYASAEPAALHDRFSRYGLKMSKEWFLPKFQKLRGEIDYLDGTDLDRYSRYQFSLFGDDRLFGYSGTGVRFDDGVIARAGYSFNLFEAIRFDAAVENAWVAQDGSLDGRQSFTGVGLTANVVGPWKTVINLNYGYALKSDIPSLEGGQEFLLIILKLF